MRRNLLASVIFVAVIAVGTTAAAQTANGTIVTQTGQSGSTATTATLLATATITSSIQFTVDDNTLECGNLTVNYGAGSGTCEANGSGGAINGTAQITVSSNVPYKLTVADAATTTANQVTLSNTTVTPAGGDFVLPLNLTSNVAGFGLLASSTDWGNAATNSETVTIDDNTATGLDYTDQAGTYQGTFTIVIAAQP